MPPTEAQKRASDKYNREHMATLGCKVTKEQAQAFKEYCQNKGSTANKMLRAFVLKSIKPPDSSEAPPAPDETPNAETLEAFAELDNGGGHSFRGTTEQLFTELIEDEGT